MNIIYQNLKIITLLNYLYYPKYSIALFVTLLTNGLHDKSTTGYDMLDFKS